jgi:hypothetical protein
MATASMCSPYPCIPPICCSYAYGCSASTVWCAHLTTPKCLQTYRILAIVSVQTRQMHMLHASSWFEVGLLCTADSCMLNVVGTLPGHAACLALTAAGLPPHAGAPGPVPASQLLPRHPCRGPPAPQSHGPQQALPIRPRRHSLQPLANLQQSTSKTNCGLAPAPVLEIQINGFPRL